METKNINFCITFTIFAFLVRRCDADCDYYGNHCDDYEIAAGVLYGVSFGLTALIAVGVALCCVCCTCCPFYRGKRRTPQTFVAAPHVIGVNSNGVSVGPSYAYPTGQAGNSAYPVQPTNPPPYNQQQYPNQMPYPPQNPPPYGFQAQNGGPSGDTVTINAGHPSGQSGK
jgi:hypothetical protein